MKLFLNKLSKMRFCSKLIGMLPCSKLMTILLLGLFLSSVHELGETSYGAEDTLVIISPHRKSIQREFVPQFREYYKKNFKKEVKVEWLDQGGTSDDVRFVRAKFAGDKASSGIDVFWGGGATTFLDLKEMGFLAKYTLPADLKKNIPATAAGVAMYDSSESWYASALSSFGIFYNKKLLKIEKINAPKTWEDLAGEKFNQNITLTDPRRSGSATMMNTIVLQSMGWTKGWELLTAIAGNTRRFTHSSSDPIKAVVSGDAVAAMAIDFYANAKIGDLGAQNLGFALPARKTVIDPDPVAILRGAPNRLAAERFVQFVLSADAQKLLMLPKGAKGGPKLSTLGRMAVNVETYKQTEGTRLNEFNPFEQDAALQVDLVRAAKMRRIFNDLVGAILVDTHKDLKKAWKAVIKAGMKQSDLAMIGGSPVTEAELLKMADKWEDEIYRNKQINAWVEYARNKYKKIATTVSM